MSDEERTKLFTTTQVAEMLNTTPAYIRVILQRSPEFQPAMKLSDSWLWTMEEIDRLMKRRGKRQKNKH